MDHGGPDHGFTCLLGSRRVPVLGLRARCQDRGLGVLITDHNVRDTLEIIDRAYILHDGAVLREGTPAEIVADPAVRRVYLGERFSL